MAKSAKPSAANLSAANPQDTEYFSETESETGIYKVQ
jgi:hypothetical protein